MQKLGHFFFNKIKIFKKGAYQPMNRLPETCGEVVSHSDWQTWRSCQSEKYFAGPKKKSPKIHCHMHNV
jgi:hypothetical protein